MPLRGLSRGVDRLSRPWVVLLSGLLFAGFVLVLLPLQADRSTAYTARAGSPDLRFTYSAENLYDIAQSYGVDGRAAYVRDRLTFDVAFPLSYGLFFATAIAFAFRRTWPQWLGLRSLSVVPLWAMAADLLENLALVGVMRLYPQPSSLLAALAAAATAAKWVLVGLSILLTTLGLLAYLFSSLRRARAA